ncbi:UbiH/UbiF/VisC/COQ6 family ubiquinone biosynthesis hydroxylase [Rhodobacteraceae bacterium NNCM2]|nr:UbiH/UbiF/VisC/COQ6 family ubiquinone biosynthesis hydroxylase [Coraliihabitans acroporae]
MERTQIAIIGGGLIGPALALALDSAGFRVTLLDAQPVAAREAPDFDGRAYAVALASQKLLNVIGVWDAIDGNAQPILDIHVGEGSAPEPLLHFDPRELDQGKFGWMVEDRWLRGALLDGLQAAGIPHIAPVTVTDVAREGTGATITLGGGETLAADLVVAADGRRSSIARSAGLRRVGWSYDQTGLVNAIEHELPHNGLAHQSFFPGGPFAVLPLTGNRSSLVWSEKRAEAERLSTLSDDLFIAEVAARIGGRLGEISLAGKRWAYPLDLTLATGYVAPRLALVGDAAHGVHPIAGQGMNMGLRDVAALAEVLTDAARIGEDIGTVNVLERYQQWRRFNATTMALGMDGLNRIFSNSSGLLSVLRQSGLRMVGSLGEVRRGLMREAIGTAGDLPRLLEGKAL